MAGEGVASGSKVQMFGFGEVVGFGTFGDGRMAGEGENGL